MVDITLLELTFPDARFTAEAEFNAPFAGRGSGDEPDDLGADTDGSTAADGGPPAASVVAILVGLVAVAVLLWLRGRGRRAADDETDDD